MNVRKEGLGTELIEKLTTVIHDSAMVYLNTQYKFIAVFVIVLAIILAVLISPLTAACFVLGALLSVRAEPLDFLLQAGVAAQLAHDFRGEQHALLVEQLVALLDQPPLVLQFEEGDPGREHLTAGFSHGPARRGGA